jgi:hypothetical protein
MPLNKKPMMQMPEDLYVDVKASGLKLALILLNRPFKALTVDFNTLKSTNRNRNYILSSSNLHFKQILKFETQMKHVTPDTLYFSEKTGRQKIVPVKVPLYLTCKEGYGFKKPVVSPNFITIWGDTTLISNIDTIYTQPLTLNNVYQNVNSNISFIKPDPEVYTSVNEANIFIDVARLIEQTITLTVTDIHLNARQQVNIYPPTVRVRFTSIYNTFNAGDTSLFKATIDSRKINKTRKCPVMLKTVPANVTIMDIEPPEVEILIFRK